MNRVLQILLNVTMTVTAALAFSKLDVEGAAVQIQIQKKYNTKQNKTKKHLVLGIDLFLAWSIKGAASF